MESTNIFGTLGTSFRPPFFLVPAGISTSPNMGFISESVCHISVGLNEENRFVYQERNKSFRAEAVSSYLFASCVQQHPITQARLIMIFCD
jgi:hypothetical protein